MLDAENGRPSFDVLEIDLARDRDDTRDVVELSIRGSLLSPFELREDHVLCRGDVAGRAEQIGRSAPTELFDGEGSIVTDDEVDLRAVRADRVELGSARERVASGIPIYEEAGVLEALGQPIECLPDGTDDDIDGIAFFEDLVGRGLNYNLTIEVGAMLLAGRRTALLRDTSVAGMPTDLVGQIYKRVDMNDRDAVGSAVHSWISADLEFVRCTSCP
jgi:hypothetical protein